MESKMEIAMRDAWLYWHSDIDKDDIPQVNVSFYEGFYACHELLMPLLEMSAPHVFASAGAKHLTDGFRPRRHQIDELVDRIKAVIPNE